MRRLPLEPQLHGRVYVVGASPGRDQPAGLGSRYGAIDSLEMSP
jgi:hypothetical protein